MGVESSLNALSIIKGRGLQPSDFPGTTFPEVHRQVASMAAFRTEGWLWGQAGNIHWTNPAPIGALHGQDKQRWLYDAPYVEYIVWVLDTPIGWAWYDDPQTLRTYKVRERYTASINRYLGYTNYLPITF